MTEPLRCVALEYIRLECCDAGCAPNAHTTRCGRFIRPSGVWATLEEVPVDGWQHYDPEGPCAHLSERLDGEPCGKTPYGTDGGVEIHEMLHDYLAPAVELDHAPKP